MSSYNMPKSLDEIFLVGETQWTACSYEPDMDMNNVASLTWFMETVGISEGDCVEVEDTQIIVEHPNYPYMLRIDSGGLGDFFSHCFDVSIVEE